MSKIDGQKKRSIDGWRMPMSARLCTCDCAAVNHFGLRVCMFAESFVRTYAHASIPSYVHTCIYIYTQLYTHVINVNVCTQVRLHRSECKEGQNVFVRILTRRHARNKIARARYVYSCMYTRAYSGIYVHTAICYMLACGRLCLRTSLHTYTDT